MNPHRVADDRARAHEGAAASPPPGHAGPGGHAAGRGRAPGARRRRVAAQLRTELLLARRLGVLAATAVVTVLWVAVLRAVPPGARPTVAGFVLLTDVVALGFLFVPALLVLERMERVDAALRLTPLRTAERVGARLAVTTGLSLLAGAAVAVAGDVPHVGVALLGIAATSVLASLIAVAVVGTASTLTTFLLRAPAIMAPLLIPTLLDGIGLASGAWLHLSPFTGGFDLLRGHMSWGGLAWLLAGIAAAAWVVDRSARRPVPAAGVPDRAVRSRPWPPHPGRYARAAAVRSFVRVDRRALVHDGVLAMLAVSVPLVAVVSRVVGGAGVAWARERHGIDLAGYLPVIWVVLLVVHTPVVFGALTGLLLLEDRDAGLLPAIATTRAGLPTLLGYRLAATAVATGAGLAVGLPLAGVVHPAGAAGIVVVIAAAAALSTVPATLMAAFAGNRVQGVAVMKVLGLPLYLPVASFFLDGAARWAFAPLPSSWAMWSLWAPTAGAALAFAAVAVVVSLSASAWLSRRFLHRALPVT